MADALHKRHSDKSKQINRNERYGAVKQQKVASISSAKQKARNYAARDEKRTRVLAKQAILRELTGDSDLLIKAHGLQLKQREEKDSSEENPYGHPLILPVKEPKQLQVKQNDTGKPGLQTKPKVLGKKGTNRGKERTTVESNREQSYTWDRQGRMQEIRIRFITRKYAHLWIRRVFGRVHPARARTFFDTNLKFQVLRTWQDIWWAGRKGWKLNIRAEYHNRYRLWLKVWRAWRTFVADQRVKNTKQALATQYAHRCQMSRVWFAWTIYINVRRTKRRKCRTAQQFATAIRKRFAWSRWKTELSAKEELHRMDQDALTIWARNLMSRMLCRWIGAWHTRNEDKEKYTIAVERANKRLCLKAWLGFRNYQAVRKLKRLQQGAAERHYHTVLVRRFLDTWRGRLRRQLQITEFEDLIQHKGMVARARRVIVHWRFYIHLRQDKVAKQDNADHHYRKHVLKMCFNALHLQAVQRRLKEMRKAMAEELLVRIQQRRVWTVWMTCCEHSEELRLYSLTRRARMHYRRKVLRKGVVNWLHYCLWRRERRSQYARADYHFKVTALPRYFERMRVFVEQMHIKKDNYAASEKFRREVLLAQTFYKWWSSHQLCMDVRMLQRMAILHYDEVLSRRFIRFWLCKARQKQRELLQEQAAIEHSDRMRLVQTLKTWKEFVREQQKSRITHHTAVRHYYCTLVRKAWNLWSKYVQGKQLKWRKVARADVHYQQTLLEKLITAWKLFTVHRSKIHQLVERKVKEHNYRNLRRAVSVWVSYTRDHKHKRESYHIAKKYWKRSLLSKVFLSWREYAVLHAVKMYQVQVKVQEIRERLNMGQTRRAFLAWAAFCQSSQREKELRSRAEHHYTKQLAQKSLESWRLFTHLCFRIKILQRQSMWLHNHRIMSRFLQQWRDQYALSLQVKSKTVLALWHWSRVLQQKAFYSLLSYAINRKRKALRIERALEQRRTRMLRLGVTQWMKVAFHLAAERTRFAQARSLKEAFNVQQCVYRCAMHWQREAAKRIQQRGGKAKSLQRPTPDILQRVTRSCPTTDFHGISRVTNLIKQPITVANIERVFPEPYRERPKPRKPEYLRESFDVSKVSMTTDKTLSPVCKPISALRTQVIQGVADEAEPRPPPPLPSPQHRLHRHPHRRPPGDESIVFGPLSECEEPCAERARVQQIGGQTRTSGLLRSHDGPGKKETKIRELVPEVEDFRTSQARSRRVNTPEPKRAESSHRMKTTKPRLLPPSSFGFAVKAKDGASSGQAGERSEAAARKSQELRLSGSTLPRSSPTTSPRTSSGSSVSPSPERSMDRNDMVSHCRAKSRVGRGAGSSHVSHGTWYFNDDSERSIDKGGNEGSSPIGRGAWCLSEDSEQAAEEVGGDSIGEDEVVYVSLQGPRGPSSSFLKDQSTQERILTLRDTLQGFQDLKLRYRSLQKEKDELLQRLHDNRSYSNGVSYSDKERTRREERLQNLTDEIAQLSERISSDRPNMERVARAVRELIQAAGIT